MSPADNPTVKPAQPTPVLPGVIGAVLGLLLLLASWIGSLVLLFFVLLMVVLSALELYAICVRREIKVRIVPTVLAMVALPLAASIWGPGGLGVALGVLAAALLALLLVSNRGPGFVSSLSISALFVYFIGLCSSHLILLRESDRGHRLMILLIAIVAGYHAGRWVSQARIQGPAVVPSIADSVSWTGIAGGLLVATVASMLAGPLVPLGIVASIALGLIVAIAAAIGDVGGVMFTEQLGVTRRESWVPGVGGLFSRMTTVLFAAPACFYGLRLYLT